jgi:hypothetical protein
MAISVYGNSPPHLVLIRTHSAHSTYNKILEPCDDFMQSESSSITNMNKWFNPGCQLVGGCVAYDGIIIVVPAILFKFWSKKP